jgi:hypothetical protein
LELIRKLEQEEMDDIEPLQKSVNKSVRCRSERCKEGTRPEGKLEISLTNFRNCYRHERCDLETYIQRSTSLFRSKLQTPQ